MANHENDRHVLAAAVSCGASIIVTLNLRHFRREYLEPWGVVALHPESFLSGADRIQPVSLAQENARPDTEHADRIRVMTAYDLDAGQRRDYIERRTQGEWGQ
jgi:hypothetical protein